ncbi:hypothetical protein N7454_001812 [Penicillium verhagenii]|nr:hypothetical protein N7454_001812 [Penicillium verhagenii]
MGIRSHSKPRRLGFPSCVLTFLASSAAAIPYTPSSIFLAPQYNDSLAYLLRPSSSSAGGAQFLSSISLPLLEKTPFQSTDQTATFLPVIDDRGVITVYTGNCHNSSDPQEVWQFHSDKNSTTGNGTWAQVSVESGGEDTKPNYLAAGFAFTTTNNNDSSMYSFGGMCPFANSTDQTWISDADYSQSMVALAPNSTKTTYDAKTVGTRAPPIAEAGVAIVSLPAAYSKTETQQDFLLVGGHTRQAFLNMSQLAIFSLPQESWSFVTASSQKQARTELAIRDEPLVTPRSGHAAVLSEDGTKVFVIGGWVGDISTPADPQVAVLEVGSSYGGSGDWTWSIPSSSTGDAGITEGTGIYGHSVAMLPGGVLMIAGGYTIPKQSTKRSSTEHNSKVYLYNSTSGGWVTSYTNPSAHTTTSTSSSHKHGLSSSQKIGVGVGLGLGIPLAILAIVIAWKYYQKRRVSSQRNSQLREFALGAERPHFWGRGDPLAASSIRSSQMSEKKDPSYPWSGNQSTNSRPIWKGNDQNERYDLLVEVPSPDKNIRPDSRPINTSALAGARPYRTSLYPDWRRSDATGEIHPIDEREEDEEILRERLMSTIPKEEQQRPQTHDSDDPFSDTPFATPRSTIFGVGLGPFYTRRKDMGATDVDGNVSPTKSDRTSTNLSDSSAFSFSSTKSTKPISQVPQARVVYIDRDRPLSWASSGGHSVEGVAASTHSRETAHSDVDGMTAPSEKSYSADSYSTARTTIAERQAENTSLLFDADQSSSTDPSSAPSPSKLPPYSKPRPSEWMMQTVRRALTLTRRSPTNQLESETETAPLASGVDRRSTVLGPGPYPSNGSAITPRRAVSASAELFRRKQGAKDWNAQKRMSENYTLARSTRDDLFIGAPGYLGDDDTMEEEEEEEDWDVEGAAEGRSVQVTYTVPREKLRVVNASAADNISERSISRTLSGRRHVSG